MCLMGTLMYFFYLLLCKCFQQQFRPGLRLSALGLSACFYLVPFPLIFQDYIRFFRSFLRAWRNAKLPLDSPGRITETSPSKTILIDENEALLALPSYTNIFWILIGLWCFMILIFLIVALSRYNKSRRRLFQISQETCYCHTYKTLFGRKKSIQVRIISQTRSPFVIGYRKPVIFLPESQLAQAEMILLHETNHVRYFDHFAKLLALAVLVVHWYCPIVYFYFLSVSNTLELLCDQRVLHDASDEEREQYVNLLLGTPCSAPQKLPYLTHFSGFEGMNYHFLKERILMIKKHSAKKSVWALVLTVVFTCLSAIPVIAYEPPHTEMVLFEAGITIEPSAELFFIPDGVPGDKNVEDISNDPHFAVSDSYFLSEEGEAFYDITGNSNETVCKHTYLSGTSHTHERTASGGCTVTIYDAKHCQTCWDTPKEDIISSADFKNCPHS